MKGSKFAAICPTCSKSSRLHCYSKYIVALYGMSAWSIAHIANTALPHDRLTGDAQSRGQRQGENHPPAQEGLSKHHQALWDRTPPMERDTRARRRSATINKRGIKKIPTTEAAIMPPNTGVPTAWRVAAPAP